MVLLGYIARILRLAGPLGSLLSIIAVVAGASVFLAVRLEKIDNNLLVISNEMKLLKTADRWRGTDMEIWVLQLEKNHPELDLPSPRGVIEDRLKGTDSF